MAKWIPTESDLIQIEDWIAEGMTEGTIHKQFGVCQSVWYSRKRERPEIAQAILRGKTRDEEVCMNILRQRALDDKYRGSLTALIFYGKINFGWNDGSRNDSTKIKPSSVKFKEIGTDGNTGSST